MNIKTKYNIGDTVYACWFEYSTVRVIDAKINEIVIDKNKQVLYYLDSVVGEKWKEEELIPITDHENLVSRIDYLLERKDKEDE